MKNYIILFLFSTVMFSCKPTRNLQYLQTPSEYKYDVLGSYVNIKQDRAHAVRGEIITVTNDEMIVLVSIEGRSELITLERSNLSKFDLFICGSSESPGGIMTTSAVLPLYSIGHGYLAIYSLPINLATGFYMHKDVNTPYKIKYPEGINWANLHKFARFPQGIPEGVDINTIR